MVLTSLFGTKTLPKKADLIQTWKILHKFDDIDENLFFERLHTNAQRPTRANQSAFNLRLKNVNLDVRRHAFPIRVINAWNALPERVKSCNKIATFSSLQNKF